MRAIVSATLVMACLLGTRASAGGAVVLDRVAALVDDHAITGYVLERKMASLRKQDPELRPDELKQRALDELIDSILIWLECERREIKVVEAEVQATLAAVMEDAKKTPEQFEVMLRDQGYDRASYRAYLVDQLFSVKLEQAMGSVAGDRTKEEKQRDRARIRQELRKRAVIELKK